MHAIGHRAWAPLATLVVAVGAHAVIVAALPKRPARPVVVLSAETTSTSTSASTSASTSEAVESVRTSPSVAAAGIASPSPALAPQQPAAKARPRGARVKPAAVRAANVTGAIKARLPAARTAEEAPVTFETPLPVTIVTPPANASE